MEYPDIDDSIPLPNLDGLDLLEISGEETASIVSSSSSSPLGSPFSLDAQVDSPESNFSSGSYSTCTSPNLSRQDSDSSTSSTSSRGSKHRAKCNRPNCIKKEHTSILRRNERERNRVKLVSDGFSNLRKHIPTMPVNKKLSKVETLRNAIEYIKHLQRILNESNRIERDRRFRQLGSLGLFQKLQAQSQAHFSQQAQIAALLMELPEIAPNPMGPLPQVNGLTTENPMSMVNYYSLAGTSWD